MGKSSSSSLKKKRSKLSSSQARINKRSKSRSKRSSKLKKLRRRRDDSLSYSSGSDDSRSSVSVSYSTSEDDIRGSRSRSRSRKDVKGSKKRARRQSSSYESSEDSHHFKRRKKSRRSEDSRVKKKLLERKKKEKKKKSLKREVSVSSTSRGSWSCSTCQGVSSSDESEVEKNKGSSERKDKHSRFEKVQSESRRMRSRSRSCSSCSHYSDYGNEEKLTGDVTSRRLRSVIVVAREGSEGRGMDKDDYKEEMECEYDHDDYPPSRSNDSNDGGSKRELVHNSHFTSEDEKTAEAERGEDAVVSNLRTVEVTEVDKDSEGYDGSNPVCDGVLVNDYVKKKEIQDSKAVDSPDAYDLESKLRQKALENLRSFRRGHQTDGKAPVCKKDLIYSNVKTLSKTKAELFQNPSPKGVGVSMGQVAKQHSISVVDSKVSTDFSQNDRMILGSNYGGKESGAEGDVTHLADRVVLAGSHSEQDSVACSSELNKPRLNVLASRWESSNSCTSKKQMPALQKPSQSKSMTGNSVLESVVENVQTVVPVSGKSSGEELNKACGSSSNDPSGPKNMAGVTDSNKSKDEAKEDSQFEQKTMTVMRGGEMVEVSYKVYIPKKAPALSRRPLRR